MDFTTIVLSACAWVAYVTYTLCFIPQIITNYRIKSGSGISEFFLFGYLNLHAIFLFYIFLLDLPLPYKFCVPVQLALVLVMIVQRLWYDNAMAAKRMALYYLINIALLLLLIPFALKTPIWFGHLGGWATLGLGYLSQAPQAFKMWRERSVVGFDKTFVYMLLLAGTAEMTGALVGGLPLQTKLAALRVLLFALIFLWQFKCYAIKTDA